MLFNWKFNRAVKPKTSVVLTVEQTNLKKKTKIDHDRDQGINISPLIKKEKYLE